MHAPWFVRPLLKRIILFRLTFFVVLMGCLTFGMLASLQPIVDGGIHAGWLIGYGLSHSTLADASPSLSVGNDASSPTAPLSHTRPSAAVVMGLVCGYGDARTYLECRAGSEPL